MRRGEVGRNETENSEAKSGREISEGEKRRQANEDSDTIREQKQSHGWRAQDIYSLHFTE